MNATFDAEKATDQIWQARQQILFATSKRPATIRMNRETLREFEKMLNPRYLIYGAGTGEVKIFSLPVIVDNLIDDGVIYVGKID